MRFAALCVIPIAVVGGHSDFLFRADDMAGRVSAIRPQTRHKDRLNVLVDDRFAVGVAAAVGARLRVGQVLSDEELAELVHADAYETAHERALRFLEPRPRSASEVRQHLSKKQTEDGVIDEVMRALSEAGLIDDEAFAQYWVDNRETFRPRATRALRYELKRKGLSDGAIARAIGSVDETESAYRAAVPRAQRWIEMERRDFMEKLGAYLARRGFSYETAKATAKRLWEETHAS